MAGWMWQVEVEVSQFGVVFKGNSAVAFFIFYFFIFLFILFFYFFILFFYFFYFYFNFNFLSNVNNDVKCGQSKEMLTLMFTLIFYYFYYFTKNEKN